MKNLLLLAFSTLFLVNSNAQVTTIMPPDANTFYNNSMPLLRPAVKNIVLQTAKSMKNRRANSDSLSKTLRVNSILKGMRSNDIEGIVVLIMVQASKDADADLKNMVMGISRQNEQKSENRPFAQPVSDDMDDKAGSKNNEQEMQNLRLQMIMDRKSKMAEEVSYVMKKISGTQQNIINNLK